MNEVRSQLLAAFTGYHDGAVFRLIPMDRPGSNTAINANNKYKCRPHVASNPQP
jgi:hypothetical protein